MRRGNETVDECLFSHEHGSARFASGPVVETRARTVIPDLKIVPSEKPEF